MCESTGYISGKKELVLECKGHSPEEKMLESRSER